MQKLLYKDSSSSGDAGPSSKKPAILSKKGPALPPPSKNRQISSSSSISDSSSEYSGTSDESIHTSAQKVSPPKINVAAKQKANILNTAEKVPSRISQARITETSNATPQFPAFKNTVEPRGPETIGVSNNQTLKSPISDQPLLKKSIQKIVKPHELAEHKTPETLALKKLGFPQHSKLTKDGRDNASEYKNKQVNITVSKNDESSSNSETEDSIRGDSAKSRVGKPAHKSSFGEKINVATPYKKMADKKTDATRTKNSLSSSPHPISGSASIPELSQTPDSLFLGVSSKKMTNKSHYVKDDSSRSRMLENSSHVVDVQNKTVCNVDELKYQLRNEIEAEIRPKILREFETERKPQIEKLVRAEVEISMREKFDAELNSKLIALEEKTLSLCNEKATAQLESAKAMWLQAKNQEIADFERRHEKQSYESAKLSASQKIEVDLAERKLEEMRKTVQTLRESIQELQQLNGNSERKIKELTGSEESSAIKVVATQREHSELLERMKSMMPIQECKYLAFRALQKGQAIEFFRSIFTSSRYSIGLKSFALLALKNNDSGNKNQEFSRRFRLSSQSDEETLKHFRKEQLFLMAENERLLAKVKELQSRMIPSVSRVNGRSNDQPGERFSFEGEALSSKIYKKATIISAFLVQYIFLLRFRTAQWVFFYRLKLNSVESTAKEKIEGTKESCVRIQKESFTKISCAIVQCIIGNIISKKIHILFGNVLCKMMVFQSKTREGRKSGTDVTSSPLCFNSIKEFIPAHRNRFVNHAYSNDILYPTEPHYYSLLPSVRNFHSTTYSTTYNSPVKTHRRPTASQSHSGNYNPTVFP